MSAQYLIHHFLEAHALATPDNVLLIEGQEKHTYATINSNANRLAHSLLNRGIKRGERVALLAKNSAFYIQAYYAILKTGAIAVPLNTAATPDNLRFFLNDCGAAMVLVGTGFERLMPNDTPSVRDVLLQDTPLEAATHNPAIKMIDLDCAAIVYTSGSTGRPRGATLTHLNLVSNTRSIVEYLNLTAADRMCAILPFYYVYGTSLLNTHVAVGASLAIENRVAYPNVILDTLEQHQCTGFAGVPSTFTILLSRSNLAERHLPHLRYVTQAGAAMAPELTKRLLEILPGKDLVIMYGASEASARISYLKPSEISRKLGSIGQAIPNVEVVIRDADGNACGVDEVGEIVVRGANIMQGYWGDSAETSRVLTQHGYHTGDLGRMDAEGFVYVVGRKKDMIKVGAHRVSPKEIEEAIAEFSGVVETAVIGISDEILGEAPHAFVVLQDETIVIKSLEQHLRRRLPAYKQPKAIEVRQSLPKNESGKIMKEVLRSEKAG